MIHNNAFSILNDIFSTARYMEQIQIPIGQVTPQSLIRLVNQYLINYFDKQTSRHDFMTDDIKAFCHKHLMSKVSDDIIEDDDTNETIDIMLNNDILSCSDMLFATTIPNNLPGGVDPYLKSPELKWFEIKSGFVRLGYIVIDPQKLGFVIVKISSKFTEDLRRKLTTDIKFIIFFLEQLTDMLIKQEQAVINTVSNIMERIMVISND